jgi:methionyl-tRNA formyltransferase
MSDLRIVFFGSPEFAVPTLAALVESPYRPQLVVSQPARRVGRGRRVEDPPVAAWAKSSGLVVEQPERVRAADFVADLEGLAPDLAVVVAFGQIFPQALLDVPRLGCVNLHASLLPKYRGAAPIQAAIVAGERETGVCTMRMEAGLDTGPVYLCEATSIEPDDDAPRLSGRLAQIGSQLMLRTITALESGTATATPQIDAEASYAPRLGKEDGWVQWSEPAALIARKARAYRPWPGLTADCRGEALKLFEVSELLEVDPASAAPGTFLGLHEGSLAVVAGAGSVVAVARVQRPGRRVSSAAEFLQAVPLEPAAIELRTMEAG